MCHRLQTVRSTKCKKEHHEMNAIVPVLMWEQYAYAIVVCGLGVWV